MSFATELATPSVTDERTDTLPSLIYKDTSVFSAVLYLLWRIAVLRTELRPIVTDGVAWSVCLSVCHDHEPRKTAEPIAIPFGLLIWVGPRKYVLDGGPDLSCECAMGKWAVHCKVYLCGGLA